MFHVYTIHLAEQRQDKYSYALVPQNEEGLRLTARLANFLAARQPEFREKLPFLKRDLELEWTAGPGGVALASFYDSQAPRTIGILLAGVDAEADRMMYAAWRDNVLKPLMGGNPDGFAEAPQLPALVNIVLPGSPELVPPIQMITTALASVYFRCVIQISAGASGAAG